MAEAKEAMSEAVLICNGSSANGYEAPPGVYAVTLNGGFLKHRADAAVTVDCPGHIRLDWHAFKGEKVVAKHMPDFPTGERFDCFDLVSRFGSSTPAALAWLHERKGCQKVTIVGLDSLWGRGDPRCKYNRDVMGMLGEMAQYFPGGLWVQRDGKSARVGTEELVNQVQDWTAAAAAAPAVPMAPDAVPPRRIAPTPPCKVPQTMVEFDVSPRCTRKCSFCAPGIPAGRREQRDGLSLEAHNRIIDELVTLGYNRPQKWLCYCGHGEPLLSPALLDMLRYARRKMLEVRIALYTNVDKLDDLTCRVCEAFDITLIADLYDAEAGPKLARLAAATNLDPAAVHIVDHVGAKQFYSSRCSTVKPGNVSEWIDKPCAMPAGKLFFTDDGKGGAASLLCCEDYGRESIAPLNTVALAIEAQSPAVKLLADGKRKAAPAICRKCDRDGGHPAGFAHVPTLAASKFWPVPAALPKLKGERLVVIPVNSAWAENAEIILDAIDRASTMPGKSLVIWNDPLPPPEALKGPNRILWAYKQSLGWCGINRGIARALRYALEEKYAWVIKIDTDTAILRRGWDSLLCADCPRDCQAGTYMDVTITGQLPRNAKGAGLFNATLEDTVPWGRRIVQRFRRGWDHIQGGCYVIGDKALRQVDAVVGLGAEEQDTLEENYRVGEDVYLDTKCKLAGVRQLPTLRALSWYREPSMADLQLTQVRYHRDALGVCAEHPVKSKGMLATLAGEIA